MRDTPLFTPCRDGIADALRRRLAPTTVMHPAVTLIPRVHPGQQHTDNRYGIVCRDMDRRIAKTRRPQAGRQESLR